jgi:hypothetical protein
VSLFVHTKYMKSSCYQIRQRSSSYSAVKFVALRYHQRFRLAQLSLTVSRRFHHCKLQDSTSEKQKDTGGTATTSQCNRN